MTHGEEEAQTKEEKKEKSRVPLHDTSGCTFFWFFYILGEGGEIEGKKHEEDNERAVPQHNTWRRRSTNVRSQFYNKHNLQQNNIMIYWQ